MQVLRLATLALLAVCAASGCRTAGVDELARPGPPLASNTANVAAILAEHNRNAERIQVIRANPVLTVTVKDRERSKRDQRARAQRQAGDGTAPQLQARAQSHRSGKVGDLGSNETEYWFWIKPPNKTQRALYYCNYDEAEANAQAVTFQPDWIKEAMGLRVIPEDEAADITVTSGEAGKARFDPPAPQEQRQDLYPCDHSRSGHASDPGAPAPQRRSKDDPGTRRGARGLQDLSRFGIERQRRNRVDPEPAQALLGPGRAGARRGVPRREDQRADRAAGA